MKLTNLTPETLYKICVMALGDLTVQNVPGNESSTMKCEEEQTIADTRTVYVGSVSQEGIRSVLTRRLGLIVGCCLGFVVFIVLVTVLGYLKVKKQRAALKREQPVPPEYISYRHFSIQSGDPHAHGNHPQFVTSMSTTSAN